MIKYFKRHGVLLTFLGALFLISIIIGILLFLKSSNDSKKYVSDLLINIKENLLNSNVNNVFKHLLILLIITFLSLTVIGYISGFIYVFYEGISFGYTICALVNNFKMKGLLFGLLYNIIFKFIFIIIYVIILLKLFDLVRLLLNYLVFKKSYSIKNNLRNIILSIFILILIIFINDIIIYFFTNFLLKLVINVL